MINYLLYQNFFKICREALLVQESEALLNSLQHYFQSEEKLTFSDFLKRLKFTPKEFYPRIVEALSKSQINSKLWLIEKLVTTVDIEGKVIYIVGGWFGILSLLMNWTYGTRLRKIISFDIDPIATKISRNFNKFFIIQHHQGRFAAATADMYQTNYKSEAQLILGDEIEYEERVGIPDIIINTSCEHLKIFSDWYRAIPNETTLVLQSNNFTDCVDHFNCVESLEKFKLQAPMGKYLFEGVIDCDHYSRFMLIGVK